jgi:hypothetical protein
MELAKLAELTRLLALRDELSERMHQVQRRIGEGTERRRSGELLLDDRALSAEYRNAFDEYAVVISQIKALGVACGVVVGKR